MWLSIRSRNSIWEVREVHFAREYLEAPANRRLVIFIVTVCLLLTTYWRIGPATKTTKAFSHTSLTLPVFVTRLGVSYARKPERNGLHVFLCVLVWWTAPRVMFLGWLEDREQRWTGSNPENSVYVVLIRLFQRHWCKLKRTRCQSPIFNQNQTMKKSKSISSLFIRGRKKIKFVFQVLFSPEKKLTNSLV